MVSTNGVTQFPGIPPDGATNQVLKKVSNNSFDVDWGTGGGGASAFINLTDVPNSYVGQAGKLPAVNGAETGLEFIAVGGTGTVTSVSAGAGLTASPNPITAAGSIAIANTAVSAGDYTAASISVNARGQITAASNTSVGVTSVSAGGGLTASTNPIVSTGDISIANTAVSAGTYSLATVTVNSRGQITGASNGSAGSGTVTSVSAGGGLSASTNPIVNTGDIFIANTAVSAGAYTLASITVNSRGQITAAANGAAGSGTVTSVSAGGGLTASTNPITNTGDISIADTAVSAGTYSLSTVTVNSKGQITAASNGSAGAGTVTAVSGVAANGFAVGVTSASTTPQITVSTTVNGILKGNGTAVTSATQGTDYYAPGGVDVAIADGGTASSTAASARAALGVSIIEKTFFMSSARNVTVPLYSSIQNPMTINGLRNLKTASGSVTASIQINASAVTGLSGITVNTSANNPNATAANALVSADRATLVLASNSSAVGVEFTIRLTL